MSESLSSLISKMEVIMEFNLWECCISHRAIYTGKKKKKSDSIIIFIIITIIVNIVTKDFTNEEISL